MQSNHLAIYDSIEGIRQDGQDWQDWQDEMLVFDLVDRVDPVKTTDITSHVNKPRAFQV